MSEAAAVWRASPRRSMIL